MTKKQDIKYLNIPNVCFSLTIKGDKREKKFSKQRIKRGFDDSETWSLSDTIANFMIPRLERYVEIVDEKIKRDEQNIKDTEKFLIALKLLTRDNGSRNFTKKERKLVNKGLDCFPKIFEGLWW